MCLDVALCLVFNDTSTTEVYTYGHTLSLPDALPICCGMPTPATMRVVQIEPGPMPTFTASAPASTRARAPPAVATLPATTCVALDRRLIWPTAPRTPWE